MKTITATMMFTGWKCNSLTKAGLKNRDKTTSCLGYLSDEFVKQENIKVLSRSYQGGCRRRIMKVILIIGIYCGMRCNRSL